jgi:hypothetical protein
MFIKHSQSSQSYIPVISTNSLELPFRLTEPGFVIYLSLPKTPVTFNDYCPPCSSVRNIFVLLPTLVVSSSSRKHCSTVHHPHSHLRNACNSACSYPIYHARCCRLSLRLDINSSSPLCSLRVEIQPRRSQQLKISRSLRNADLGYHSI